MQVAPFFDTIADGPTGGGATWLTTADGRRIRAGHWPISNAKGSVIIFPGRTEYIEKYGAVAADLAQAGYGTLTVDWRGQGLADRLIADAALGHVADFTDYQQDVRALMDHASAINLPQPWFLIAHSMGGCIALRHLTEDHAFRAVMFSAPMWGIRMDKGMRAFAWGLSGLSLRLRFDERIVPGQQSDSYLLHQPFAGNLLTNDAAQYARMRAQVVAEPALSLGGPSLRWLNAALREMRHLARLPAPRLPAIAVLGGQESIVDAGAIRQRMAHWPDAVLHDYPKGQHELLMEIPETRADVLARTIAHFDANR
jgi:lysophospholipase